MKSSDCFQGILYEILLFCFYFCDLLLILDLLDDVFVVKLQAFYVENSGTFRVESASSPSTSEASEHLEPLPSLSIL